MKSNFFLISLLIVIYCFCFSSALTGFDISQQECQAGFSGLGLWECFADDGFGFAVIEAIQGGNGMTSTIQNCVSGASVSGMAVSLYGWFCPLCYGMSSGYNAAYNAINNLKAQNIYPGVNYTYFYMDVEECDPTDDCWSDYTTNKNFLVDLVQGAQDAGASVGIYASPYEWKLLFGSDSWTNPIFDGLPLVFFLLFILFIYYYYLFIIIFFC